MLVVALPAGRVGSCRGLLFRLDRAGLGAGDLSSKMKGHARWNWSKKSVLPFPSVFVRIWESSGCGSLREGAEPWKSFSGTWCLWVESWRSAGICWGRRGWENAAVAFSCWQGNVVDAVRMSLGPLLCGFCSRVVFRALGLCLGLPLCSSSQKTESRVVQYLSDGSYSRVISLLRNTASILSETFFFLQATQSRLGSRLFSLLS